jgi:hypothetical protein
MAGEAVRAEPVRVKMIASRRDADYRFTCGQIVAVARDLAERFFKEGAAIPFAEPLKAPPPAKKEKPKDVVFSTDGAAKPGVKPKGDQKAAAAKPEK